MRFIKIEETRNGFSLNPEPYLEQISNLEDNLPAGAWAFTSDPAHYDFCSERCVKDLKAVSATADAGGPWGGELKVGFRFNDVSPLVLHIGYRQVADVSADSGAGFTPVAELTQEALAELGPLLLDEILPSPAGCTHELKFVGGTLRISCSDLEAVWCEQPASR
jgi:hypothetical protein